jgi:hypothetical protein
MTKVTGRADRLMLVAGWRKRSLIRGDCQAWFRPSFRIVSWSFTSPIASELFSSQAVSIMAPSQAPSTALLRSLRALAIGPSTRSLSSSHLLSHEVGTTTQPPLDPATVTTRREEWELFKAGTPPIGSRRRRAAQAQTLNVPFEELPYQCFQEARKILIEDRAEKLKQIETERGRIARWKELDPNTLSGGDMSKQRKLKSMEAQLEKLKILADINDPNVKRRFEDGLGKLLRSAVSQSNVVRRYEQTHLSIFVRTQMA